MIEQYFVVWLLMIIVAAIMLYRNSKYDRYLFYYPLIVGIFCLSLYAHRHGANATSIKILFVSCLMLWLVATWLYFKIVDTMTLALYIVGIFALMTFAATWDYENSSDSLIGQISLIVLLAIPLLYLFHYDKKIWPLLILYLISIGLVTFFKSLAASLVTWSLVTFSFGL